MTGPTTATHQSSVCDVAIMGGGAAGLALALQLSKGRPGTSIIVVERTTRAPEAAHKVGESTVDIGASYLRDVLGLEAHLTSRQLDKFGLRYFFTDGDNEDIARRVELGHVTWPPQVGATYQLDRGRFENTLTEELIRRGVQVWTGHRVRQVDLAEAGGDHHRVSVTPPAGGERQVEARWVIDATGRSSTLKRQLGLARKVGHHANAVWFRISENIDIDDWSNDPAWHDRIRDGSRRLSTNHLMGEGYWVWLIPLASDAISIGIVTDPAVHRFDRMNRFEKALEWLQEYEPQCARAVEPYRDKLLDFRIMKDYAYGCTQVYSEDRWCLSGEAGIFIDPLYSPGFDVISISNGLVTDLVTRSLDGEDISDLAAIHNSVFFLITDTWFQIYEGMYPVMGNARVMGAKIIWDTAVYWAVPALLFFNDVFRQLVDRPRILSQLARLAVITERIQPFFRQWYVVETGSTAERVVSYYDFDFLARLHRSMTANLANAELDDQLTANLDLLERLAGKLVGTVIAECTPDSAGGARQRQAEQWRSDDELMRLVDGQPSGAETDAWAKLRSDALVGGGTEARP